MEPLLRAAVDAYLRAFAARDMAACLAAFDESAVVDFQLGTFRGAAEIEAWHADRFAAGLEVVRVDAMAADGDVVRVDVVVASTRLAAWRIASLPARVTLRFSGGRIVEARMAPRLDPFRSDLP